MKPCPRLEESVAERRLIQHSVDARSGGVTPRLVSYINRARLPGGSTIDHPATTYSPPSSEMRRLRDSSELVMESSELLPLVN